jgi:hypothetical protein
MEKMFIVGNSKVSKKTLTTNICRIFLLILSKMPAKSCMTEFPYPTSMKPSKMMEKSDTLNLVSTLLRVIKMKRMEIL